MTEFQSLILKAINAALLGKKIVVKRKGNKFYLAEVPIDKIDRVPTMAQKKQLNRFSAAALYAREAVGNAELEKMYKSTRQIENLQGCKIKAFATDLAGNIREKEITL